jgi:orotidine-5'-phosphate decarboxylase
MLCVGLDPILPRFPPRFQTQTKPVFEFNKFVIDTVADLVCAFKPQIAHYSAIGAENQLEDTVKYLRKNYPDILIILDAKRGDIGSTAEMYVREAFDRYDADAVTVNPFMGEDTVLPFLERPDRSAILLCRTSNAGATMIQDKVIEDRSVSAFIAEYAERHWNVNRNVMLVVGATSIAEMAEMRKRAPNLPFLVPGVGAQGGDPSEAVRVGIRSTGDGLIVASSRAVIYAGDASEIHAAAAALRSQLMLPQRSIV